MKTPFAARSIEIGISLFYVPVLRTALLYLMRRAIRARLDDRRTPVNQRKIVQQRRSMSLAIVQAVEDSVKRGNLSPRVARISGGLWARLLLGWADRRLAAEDFRERNHRGPPLFMAISPGRACNMNCAGCYAGSDSGEVKLEWSLVNRIVSDAKKLWNIKLVVLSGGEPLAYRSEGRGILDLAEQHSDLLFLMFTNGALLDENVARRLGRMGNLTPAVSVEGMQARTDQRRGEGSFDTAVKAMGHLRLAGVPFGVSVTVARSNVNEVLSDPFLDFFFDRQGAFYGFFFQYMPIGRALDLGSMPTPEERVAFWRKMWRVIESRKLFVVDMWNHGPLVMGCMSAGREDGYVHVDWNGRVTPCVFIPYSVGNVRDIYERGGTLNDLWHAPFFEHIRQWQDSYGFARREPCRHADWLRPCPFRDHHRMFREWIDVHRPELGDGAAGQALLEDAYRQGMYEYGETLDRLVRSIWEREYMGKE